MPDKNLQLTNIQMADPDFDSIFEERIGHGRYQERGYWIIGLGLFAIVGGMISPYLILPNL